MELSQREQAVLQAVIRSYIVTGEPVGSKALCEIPTLNVSSATIRAKMSELCELGLLEQPHTSAGRIPTALGYRYYIEQLMSDYHLTDEDKNVIDSLLPHNMDQPERIIEQACEALAELTNCAAMLTTPADERACVKKVNLIMLGRKTVMAVLVTSSGIIKNKITRCDLDISIDLLEKVDNILKQTVYGMPLSELNMPLSQMIIMQLGAEALTAAPIIIAVFEAAGSAADAEVKLKGESNLLRHREFSSSKASQLLEYLKKKNGLIPFLKNVDNGISVVLGDEIGESALSSSGVIITRYNLFDRQVGSIAILGPDRMDYEHIIPSILYFRDSLSRLLTESFLDEDYF
ncbi:MAG: heat-inducible transcription repressor HrcA [Clostridia bacterium]|nr:heat-inducible transcription repressor HrcA [Clostridia bacterium]